MTAGPGSSPTHSKTLITKAPLGTAATGKVGAKTEGSKTQEKSRSGPTRLYCTLQEVQRQVFSHLLTCLPAPMPAPALATVSTIRRA